MRSPHFLRFFSLLFSAMFFAAATFAADANTSLLPNGDFETAVKDKNWPDNWPRVNNGGSWEIENGNHFLRLTSTKAGEMTMLYQPVTLPENAKALEMSWRWRVTNLKTGQQPWFDARIIMNFKDGAGQKLDGGAAPNRNTDSKGWEERTIRFAVPVGARTLEWMPALFQVERGTLDLDDVVLKVVDSTKTEPKIENKYSEMKPEAAQPAKWPQELKVVGNQLQSKDGKTVWLQGLNVVSLEWVAGGEHVLRSAQVAVDDWKSNIIRLPIKDDFWFGTGKGQNDGGAAYRDLVDAAVNIIANRGAYVLLDLHRFRAPTLAHEKFWTAVATKYKNHPAVIFDLFNEPHGISWEVWKNGGVVEDKNYPAEEDAFLSPEDKAKNIKGFRSIGMQRLLDAVRATGARNIVVIGGLDWAYDLSGIAQGFGLSDKTGNGIVYATHIYPWKNDWQNKVLSIADKYPILVGEVGADTQVLDYLPLSAQENPYTWAPDMLGFIQMHKFHWTAWTFHTGATPRLLQDWNYTPTPFWGAFVKSALLGAQFNMKKMR